MKPEIKTGMRIFKEIQTMGSIAYHKDIRREKYISLDNLNELLDYYENYKFPEVSISRSTKGLIITSDDWKELRGLLR